MKVRITELKERKLDWAVAMALGYQPAKYEKREWGKELVLAPERNFSGVLLHPNGASLKFASFHPSYKWEIAGPIIERNLIKLVPDRNWIASIDTENAFGCSSDKSPVVAAMQCFVHSVFGDEVEIPSEVL